MNIFMTSRKLSQAIYFAFTTSKYKYPYNINLEESSAYLKKVENAEKELDKVQKANLIPRRKRRIYDKPRHDLDITNYKAWRLYDPQECLFKFWAHGAPVATKIPLQPKWLVHAFGVGMLSLNHRKSACTEYHFEDNNLSKYLLYEYRNTTLYEANSLNYNYQNQDHLPLKRRKVQRLSPEDFWQSEKYFEFRVNASTYAERLKFRKWILETVQKCKSQPSYDQFIDKKYGTVFAFNEKQDSSRFVPFEPAIFKIGPQHYTVLKKGEKLKEVKIEISKKLDEEHRVFVRTKQVKKFKQEEDLEDEEDADDK